MKCHLKIIIGLGCLSLASCESLTGGQAAISAAEILLAAPQIPRDTTSKYGAYMLIMGRDYKLADLLEYRAALPPIYAKYGGAYVANSTRVESFEGNYEYNVLMIIGWDSFDQARRFWYSAEYQSAIKLREGKGTFHVVVVPSLSAPG